MQLLITFTCPIVPTDPFYIASIDFAIITTLNSSLKLLRNYLKIFQKHQQVDETTDIAK